MYANKFANESKIRSLDSGITGIVLNDLRTMTFWDGHRVDIRESTGSAPALTGNEISLITTWKFYRCYMIS